MFFKDIIAEFVNGILLQSASVNAINVFNYGSKLKMFVKIAKHLTEECFYVVYAIYYTSKQIFQMNLPIVLYVSIA